MRSLLNGFNIFTFWAGSKAGKASSGANYCVGLNEIELYGKYSHDIYEMMFDEDDPNRVPNSMIERIEAGSLENRPHLSLENVLDGKMDTLWHTSWAGCAPEERYITLVTKEPIRLNGFAYFPRTGSKPGDNNGRVKEYRVSISLDGVNWETLAQETLEHPEEPFALFWMIPHKAKYIRLEGVHTDGVEQDKWMSAAEIRLFQAR